MLKLIWVFTSFWLIALIFFRIPQKDIGLRNFATKSDLLGSPRSATRFLNTITGVGIFIYLIIAIQLNLLKN